ncbi:hypothetical protein RND71_005697 [Anisodus tanguticus]|uniref:Uncharacterized protein n=1 Tax=Anisodus tanguticus TaxID=243964 RepID=A0AAE1SSK6_9SOLA|nr:hypothetical protein RND71_005697 [Anisodus tanguticus]
MPLSQPITEEPIEVEDDVFVCDDNLASTENVYRTISVNTDIGMLVGGVGFYVCLWLPDERSFFSSAEVVGGGCAVQ